MKVNHFCNEGGFSQSEAFSNALCLQADRAPKRLMSALGDSCDNGFLKKSEPHPCIKTQGRASKTVPHQQKRTPFGVLCWWGMVDSDHRSQWQQIYSLPPLAAREIPLIVARLELANGVEPSTCWLQISCSAIEPRQRIILQRTYSII